jgi:hypothetical protein
MSLSKRWDGYQRSPSSISSPPSTLGRGHSLSSLVPPLTGRLPSFYYLPLRTERPKHHHHRSSRWSLRYRCSLTDMRPPWNRLDLLHLLLQGIEPGALESTARSPIPPPVAGVLRQNPAAMVLLRPCSAHLRHPGDVLLLMGLLSFSIRLSALLPALTATGRCRSSSPALHRWFPAPTTATIRFTASRRSSDAIPLVSVLSETSDSWST